MTLIKQSHEIEEILEEDSLIEQIVQPTVWENLKEMAVEIADRASLEFKLTLPPFGAKLTINEKDKEKNESSK